MVKMICGILSALPLIAFAQNNANDGDWKSNYVVLNKTPQAEMMIRGGDIDNLGFGWNQGSNTKFDPFSGKSTEAHGFPWTPDTSFMGTDMIMVPSKAFEIETSGTGSDGYSGEKQNNMDKFGSSVIPINIPLNIPESLTIKGILLQMFVDDFQAPVMGSKFEVKLNGKRAPFIEQVINKLNQTGPIGKLISIPVPAEFHALFRQKNLKIEIDDMTTGAGDGFAIDFVKILINPNEQNMKKLDRTITIKDHEGKIISGAIVEMPDGTLYKSNEKGQVKITGLYLGHYPLQISYCGYADLFVGLDVEEGGKDPEPYLLSPKA
jgi:hypothetical protein